jgi:two-component SAPR family response regulator
VSNSNAKLWGKRLLVVEDDYFIIEELLRELERAGAEIIGPAAQLRQALHLAQTAPNLDGAILDINVQGELIFPVADAIAERGLPFVFLTGYDREAIPPRFDVIQHLVKPVRLEILASALFRI